MLIADPPLFDSLGRILTGKKLKQPDHPCELCGRDCPGRRRKCLTCIQRLQRLRVKIKAVELLGGVAVCCGWRGRLPEELAGYHFHHVADDKDFEIGTSLCRRWDEVEAELRKCELWCARCHAIHHSRYDDPRLIAAIKASSMASTIANS